MRFSRKALTLFFVASQDVLSTSSAFHGVALATSSAGPAGRRHHSHVAESCAANSLRDDENKRGLNLSSLKQFFQRNRNNMLSTRGGSTTAVSSTTTTSLLECYPMSLLTTKRVGIEAARILANRLSSIAD